MEVIKIMGFICPVAKEKDVVLDSDLFGHEINSDNKLFDILTDIFDKAKKECDIQIRFTSQSMQQDNEIRESIQSIVLNFNKENCLPLVKSLAYLTDNKTKEGLLFFVLGEDNNEKRLYIARFPSETGITIQQNAGVMNFVVIEEMFLKNSRKYKAVYYDSKDSYWIGYAVDKQLNSSSGKIKEISDYWIKDFLKSELKMNAKRGSSILAKAVRRTIAETSDETVKSELIGATQLIKNINARAVSMNTFFSELNLSDATHNEVLSKIENQNLFNITFPFDSSEFESNCSYLVNILDTGAVIMAPTSEFSEVWFQEAVAESDELKYSTQGKKIKEKISNRVN
ncbi:MAG: hypothetical protein DRH89_01595 [Candidatus Cloacimonadota bacterium]|nr:MAG: hypothetical protein DRH89_01595 [Candidatus Cloacimonadota bacterium]